MGQIEIHEFLKQNKDKKFTTNEIAANMSVTKGSVCESMKRMRKTKVVNYEIKDRSIVNNSRRPVTLHWYKEC